MVGGLNAEERPRQVCERDARQVLGEWQRKRLRKFPHRGVDESGQGQGMHSCSTSTPVSGAPAQLKPWPVTAYAAQRSATEQERACPAPPDPASIHPIPTSRSPVWQVEGDIDKVRKSDGLEWITPDVGALKPKLT